MGTAGLAFSDYCNLYSRLSSSYDLLMSSSSCYMESAMWVFAVLKGRGFRAKLTMRQILKAVFHNFYQIIALAISYFVVGLLFEIS